MMNRLIFAVAIGLGAFLLFLVQPLIARFILPWFGGGHAVWTGCMLFFQCALLAGYAYAHAANRLLGVKGSARLHWLWLLLSLAFLPLMPSDALQPDSADNPMLGIVWVLAVSVGLPYLVLSTTGPLLQSWFVDVFPGRSPYRLFALSNFGSLVGLFAYPFLFEPWLKLSVQGWGWSALYVLYVVCCACCGWLASRGSSSDKSTSKECSGGGGQEGHEGSKSEKKVDPGVGTLPWPFRIGLWLVLAFVPSICLVATTSQLCQEVAVVPFLWTVPLGLYLLSFVICFDRPRWYHRGFWGTLLFLSLLLAEGCLYYGVTANIGLQVAIFSLALFAICMVCHGELARFKPEPKDLTLFYLCLSLGGACGGLFVGLIAPVIFADYWELPMAYFIAPIVVAVAWHADLLTKKDRRWLLKYTVPLTIGLVAAWGGALWIEIVSAQKYLLTTVKEEGLVQGIKETLPRLAKVYQPNVVFQDRDEYGVLKVTRWVDGHKLINGRIEHGFQPRDEERALKPASYYAPSSGLGLAMREYIKKLPTQPRRQVGVVGLGMGAIAAWGTSDDDFTFYELNPSVEKVAREYFTYLEQSPAEIDVVLGDARVALERELVEQGSRDYDLLVIDAFSSDAIPQHLMTREAFEVYFAHLDPDGILAMHVSNRFLNLSPIVRNLALDAGYQAICVHNVGNTELHESASLWVLVTKNSAFMDREEVKSRHLGWTDESKIELRWTDDFGSLWQVLE